MADEIRKYMAGDEVTMSVTVKHRANLVAAFVGFEKEEGGGVFDLDWEPDDLIDPDQGMRSPGDGQSLTALTLSRRLPPHLPPGIYRLRAIGFHTAAGNLARTSGEDLGHLADFVVEIVEEPWAETAVDLMGFGSTDQFDDL